jgi:hypothetical protein
VIHEPNETEEYVSPRSYHYRAGWFKVWRQIFYSSIWTTCPHSWFRVFMALIGCANHEVDTIRFKGQNVTVPAGSVTIGTYEFARFCGVSRQQLRSALEYLEDAKAITTTVTTRYTIVSISNWDTYQLESEALTTAATTVVTTEATTVVTTGVTTFKEGKKRRNKTLRVFDPLVEDLANRLHARHPAHRRGSVAEAKQQIEKILEMFPKEEHLATVERINTNHVVACASHEWQKEGAQYAKALFNWLAPTKGRWDETPQASSASASSGFVAPKKLLM